MPFALDAISIGKLAGVHRDLLRVVEDCSNHYPDHFRFGVTEGLRSIAEQQADVAMHRSETLRSRHLDGHAVDLAPLILIDGKLTYSWAWNLFYELAQQMKYAAVRQKVPINWGGVWDKEISQLSDDMEHEMAQYIVRAKARGQKGFTDGPHFQLVWEVYPSAHQP